MPTKQVPLNGAVVAWAREESGLSLETVAASLDVDEELLAKWESGESRPTKGQFTKLVKLLKRPSAVFFLPKPPTRAAVPTSFRLAPGLGDHRLNEEEVRQIRWARRLQEIVSWALRDGGEDRVGLPRFATTGNPSIAAASVRTSLAVSPADQLAWTTPSEAFRAWRAALEDARVPVLQLGLGRNNVRGFSAWDDYAPVVAVNTAYHPTARIFTLFHEVGHLVTRTDAACLRFILPSDPEIGAERWCERFSAALLMPEEAVRAVAARLGVTSASKATDIDTARRFASRFNVSTRAVSLRLQELDLAPDGFYGAIEKQLATLDWNKQGGRGGGQPAPEKRLGQLGGRIPAVLMDAQSEGRINRLDLADYLHLTTGQVDELGSLVSKVA